MIRLNLDSIVIGTPAYGLTDQANLSAVNARSKIFSSQVNYHEECQDLGLP